jgi:hypothetical protein
MIVMMTYKRLRGYDVDILNKILKCEKEAQIKYIENDEKDHYRMSLKTVNKIEKVIKEKTK